MIYEVVLHLLGMNLILSGDFGNRTGTETGFQGNLALETAAVCFFHLLYSCCFS